MLQTAEVATAEKQLVDGEDAEFRFFESVFIDIVHHIRDVAESELQETIKRRTARALFGEKQSSAKCGHGRQSLK
jgi:Rad3-related DNA helicase